MRAHLLYGTLAALGILAAGLILAAPSPAAGASTVVQQAVSENWAGYVIGGSGASTAPEFSRVSANWVEPSVTCTTGQGYSAFWVGLGGSGEQTGSLEQVGTEADCTSGGAGDYFAWYELVPSAPVRLGLAVHPGDHVFGQVTVSGTQVTVTLSDQTAGNSTTKTLSMSNPDVSSAEWIAEAPSSCDQTSSCQPLPLADFGTVGFTNVSATAAGHTGTISDPNWTAAPVSLDGGSGSVPGGPRFAAYTPGATAQPSALSGDGASFSVAWSAGTGPASGAAQGTGYGDGTRYGYGGSGYGGYGYGSGGGCGGDGGYGAGGYGYGAGYGGYGY
jgi:hypothetical protein